MSWAMRGVPAVLAVAGIVIAGGTGMAASSPQPGSVFAFGSNFSGELGSTTNLGAANQVPELATPPAGGGAVAQVASGVGHSVVVTASGQLFAFGYNGYGQLGIATSSGTPTPTPAPAPVPLPGQIGIVAQIAAGANFSLVVTSSGQLYGFGNNQYGQLANATSNATGFPNPTPTLVTLPGQTGTVTQVSAGTHHSLVLTSSGQVFAFGHNQYGELGNTTNNGTGTANPTPALVTLPGLVGNVTQIAGGGYHSLIATSSGQLYSFGWNYYGQTGKATNNLTNTANPTPTAVTLPGQVGSVVQLAGGGYHSLALTSSGQLYAFGGNQTGQLGNATNNATGNANPIPALVSLPGQVGAITQIAGGDDHSLVVTSSGQLYSFGLNQWGQLGSLANVGTMTANPAPALVALPAGTTIDTVAEGAESYHSLALVSNLAIGTAALPAAEPGASYQATLQASGGTAPLSWSASGLAAGLLIDPASGAISGTPGAAGSFSPTITVTDVYGSSVSHTYLLTVATAPPPVAKAPRLSALKQSASSWVAGSKLARLVTTATPPARKVGLPVGTTFSFSLDQAARVTLAFRRTAQGRTVSRKCVATTKANAGKPRCTRTLSNGVLRIQARAGASKLRFEGRISAGLKLKPGRYTVVITATSDAGKISPAQSRSFTIVAP